MWESLDDAELLALGQAGARTALETLLSRYTADVRRIAAHRLRHREDIDEASQETFARVIARLPVLDGHHIGRYIRKVARFAALDVARRRGSEAERISDLADPPADPDDGPAQHVEARLLTGMVLGGLSESDVRLLRERHMLDRSLAQMAADRQTSTGAMGVMVHRALRRGRRRAGRIGLLPREGSRRTG